MKMRFYLTAAILLASLAALHTLAARAGDDPVRGGAGTNLMSAQPPVTVPGGPGHFDWMAIDPQYRRVLAAHPGAGALVVLELDGSGAVQSVKTGPVQGIAIDNVDGKLFVGGTDTQVVTILNNRTLEKLGEIKVTGPVDAMVYEPKHHMVYADNDDGTTVWVIDPKADKIVGTVTVAGAPEEVKYDPVTDRLYQNIKPASCVQVIDPVSRRVIATWPTAPATGPHGLVVDGKAHRLFAAGSNGKLVAIDTRTGKVIGSTDIARGADQIAMDPALKRIYCACGSGSVSVVEETAAGVSRLGDVPSPAGTHTICVDPKTHSVWVCYSDSHDSYLMQYAVPEQQRTE
jgi:DNA-binding beta-propeller fold protein YncE